MPVVQPPTIQHPHSWQEWQDELKNRYEYNLERWGHPCWVYKIQCSICGRVFYARRPEAKYCTDSCAENGYKQQRKERSTMQRYKSCTNCGKEFEAKRKDSIYCSFACKQSSYRKRLLLIKAVPNLPQHETVTSVTDTSFAYLSKTGNSNEQAVPV